MIINIKKLMKKSEKKVRKHILEKIIFKRGRVSLLIGFSITLAQVFDWLVGIYINIKRRYYRSFSRF